MAYKRYRRLIYEFENAIEVEEHSNGRYGAPGQKRQEKRKPTKEEIEKRNQWRKEKIARHRLRKYFRKYDYFTDLTYRVKERPPNMKAAKKQFRKFIRAVRKEYRKRGYELRWLRNIEVGTRNAWHIHIIVNRIPDTDIILADAWLYGKVENELMYRKGEFRDLAAYITKTPKTDPRLKETSYSSSRNMPLPLPEKKEFMRWIPEEKIKIPDGFYMDQEAFHEGTNPFTGRKYRVYTLLRVQQRE